MNFKKAAGMAAGALAGTLLTRAALFTPRPSSSVKGEDISVDKDKIVSDMSDMIRCKTVSNRDFDLEDKAEFEKFRRLLIDRFPTFHTSCTLHRLGRNCLLYHLKGQSDQAPSVFMSHYDVVPVDRTNWEKDPFSGEVENGVLWGRGTLDTKGTLCGILEAAEQLLSAGFVPENDIWFSFSGEEEIDGESCKAIVSYLEAKGVKPAFVLDEGGAVVEGVFPGITDPCALIGVGEKGSVNLTFEMEGNGGHASTPPVHTMLGELSQAIVDIESNPFDPQFTTPVAGMFDTLGRHAGFGYRLVFANMWLFRPVLELVTRFTGGELNAMVRTTCAATKMKGSESYNVLPSNPSFAMNLRLLGKDTIDTAIKRLRDVIDNDDIKIRLVNGMNPSITSDMDCKEYHKLKGVIHETWPDAIVSPYLMMACSDSRHYCRITDRVYRFSAMALSAEQRGMIHGDNERIPVDTLIKTVEFFIRIMREC